MVKKIIVLGVAMLICLGVLSGCGSKNYKQVDFNGTVSGGNISIEPVLIREHSKLISVFSEYDIVWKKSVAIWERYDNEFFNSKALILYFFGVSGDTEPRITIDKVEIDNSGIVQIKLIQHGKTAGLAWFPKSIVIEVSNNFVGESTKVEADIQIK